MRTSKLALAIAGVLLSAAPALAQISTGNEFATATPGKTVVGTVQMCVNSANKAVPCNTGGTGSPIGITPTDHTIVSASGASQQIMAANAARHSLTIINSGNANCGVNPTGGTAAIGGAGTFTLIPGAIYNPRIPTLSAVTVICTAAQPVYADEN